MIAVAGDVCHARSHSAGERVVPESAGSCIAADGRRRHGGGAAERGPPGRAALDRSDVVIDAGSRRGRYPRNTWLRSWSIWASWFAWPLMSATAAPAPMGIRCSYARGYGLDARGRAPPCRPHAVKTAALAGASRGQRCGLRRQSGGLRAAAPVVTALPAEEPAATRPADEPAVPCSAPRGFQP